MLNIYSRRSFLERCSLAGVGLGLAAIANMPPFIRRALAEGNIGLNGKKLIFIWQRGANDGLNTIIPALDPSYSQQRSNIYISREGQANATDVLGGVNNYNSAGAYGTNGSLNKMFDATQFSNLGGTPRTSSEDTYSYSSALPGGNGFAALHPSCKFLAPVFNDGDMAIIHRVAYPTQSRSHFDSQRYWETGVPNDFILKEGLLYRTMYEAIKASPVVANQTLTGVSFQNQLPMILRGSAAAMTNLSDPTRFSLLGVPNNVSPRQQLTNGVASAANFTFPAKGLNRASLDLQFQNMSSALEKFMSLNFDNTQNQFFDNIASDGDTDWANAAGGSGFPNKPTGEGYWLFPYSNDTNGGWRRPSGGQLTNSSPTVFNKYVIPTNQYGFMNSLKAAALVTLQTEAIVTGTEFGGFDTHNQQVAAAPNTHTGAHANLCRTWSWAIYALKRFFTRYGKGGPNELPGATVNWNDVVVITLSEFGRTSAQNNNLGTDHAEASVVLVAGGAVNGKIYACDSAIETYNGKNINWLPGTGGQNGDMFNASARYLRRAVDFRSVLGEIIRDHLGATQNQLNRIIPGYATDSRLLTGGSYTDGGNPTVAGELGLI